jgi:3-keto-5-aminohexanoate cleavage enzyme
MNPENNLIINAAITGVVLGKKDTPHLPVSIDEIVECSQRVREAGAAIVHIHARDSDGNPSCDPAIYGEIVEKVRRKTDLIVCVSLSGRLVQDVERRAAALAARPDMASLTLGSMNFFDRPSLNAPDDITALAARIYSAGAVPELEVFDTGFINKANYLIKKDVLRPPFYFNILLGSLGTAPLDLAGLGHMVAMLPASATWAAAGLGRFQLDANVMAMAAGGHVRVGLEDNIHFDRHRKDLADNPRLVGRIARIARDMGREPATPQEARRIIGLPEQKTDMKDLLLRQVAFFGK